MILIYSDAGIHKTTAVATTLFLTETKYLGTLVQTYQDVETTTLGELLGIEQGLTYANKSFPTEKKFHIYTDSETIAKAYTRRLNGEKLRRKVKYYDTWKNIMQLSEGKSITVEYIRGHQIDHNPNKVCDMLSTSLLDHLKN